MQNTESQIIIKRFFQTLYYLKDEKIIRGKATFAKRYGIDRQNLARLEKNPASDIFQAAWLFYLVRDYGVSSKWLLTGRGPIIPTGKRAADSARKLAKT
ncbi:MAG: hypothetical protein NC115_12990 [Bacteroidales bacterium]|nr:hypothetical protein [Bacteroides sp.]MCM1422155.1 hypothetical protein [Bacteroides sp.]MCM1503557.1 hypothetical protein [Bacteroidales bacterium]